MEAGLVPGIYNYCDRWCEKCKLTTRCLSYMMKSKIEEKGELNLKDEILRQHENIWELLKNVFDSTYEVLQELADERGMEVEDIYETENIDREFFRDDFCSMIKDNEKVHYLIETSDIVKICLIYESLADECLEKVFGILDEKDWKKGCEGEVNTTEALDIINWNVDVIPIKMRRALYGHYCGDSSMSEEEKRNDYNGSAKVALNGIENSVKAWEVLLLYCPSVEAEVKHIIMVLEQLSRDISKWFPQAPGFLRPGFDR